MKKIPSTQALVAAMVADVSPASQDQQAVASDTVAMSGADASAIPAAEGTVVTVEQVAAQFPKKSVSKPAAKKVASKSQKGKAMNKQVVKVVVSAKSAAVRSANQGLSFGQWAALLGRVAFQKGVEFKGAASKVEADLLAAFKAGKGVKEVLKSQA